MNKLIIKFLGILVIALFANVANSKQLKPQVTILHSSSKSSAGEAISSLKVLQR